MTEQKLGAVRCIFHFYKMQHKFQFNYNVINVILKQQVSQTTSLYIKISIKKYVSYTDF